jgi:hypothetical protein
MSAVYPNLPLFQHPVFQHPNWQPFASAIQLADKSLTPQQQQATVLQQALPHISVAIYDSRDALLQQEITAAIQTTLDGKLAKLDGRLDKLEGSVNCMINSQLGAAQLLAEQVNFVHARASDSDGARTAQPTRLPAFAQALQQTAQSLQLRELAHQLTPSLQQGQLQMSGVSTKRASPEGPLYKT